jgi:small subunit ribosomal protein S6
MERRKLSLQRDYEILYIVRPTVEEAELGDVTKRVEGLIESLEGTIQRTNVWGKRRLAYEVDRLQEGHYVLTDFQIEPARVPEMEATLKISDTVFRHLIVRRPPAKVLAPVEAGAPDVETGTAAESAPGAPPEAADEAGQGASKATESAEEEPE